MKKRLIKNSTIINEGRKFRGTVLISDGIIEKVIPAEEPLPSEAGQHETIDGEGLWLIPGIIDDQVHFREPGLTHKADIFTESRAAVAGGITSFMEMPNTIPNTLTQGLLEEKYKTGAKRSCCNYSFYMGASNDNLNEIAKTDPANVCGVKVFMGASTGNMLVDDEKTLEGIFGEAPCLIATHCEDEATIRANLKRYTNKFGDDIPVKHHPDIRNEEACLLSSSKAIELAIKHNARLHILHLSTAKEAAKLERGSLKEKKITAEVCVHHLWFSQEDYDTKGILIKWNPAIKTKKDRDGLLKALLEDRIDVIATDHAPHTIDEKNNQYTRAPSGGPLVQHSLTIMLELCHRGLIPPEKVVEKMCHAPAMCFGIKDRGFIREGYYADLVLIDPHQPWTVHKSNILYKCGWSPFEGMEFQSRVTHTFVNGALVYHLDPASQQTEFSGPGKGMRLKFER